MNNFVKIVNGKCCAKNLIYRNFKSKVNISNIYSESSLNIESNFEPPKNVEKFSGYIPVNSLSITYSRSSGPGGQHVNKVNTKVDMRFNLEQASWLPEFSKEKLKEKFKNHVNADGAFIVTSERTRSQQLNLADAIDKLRHMINTSSVERPLPRYKELENRRRLQERASRERLRQKRERSLIKRQRNEID